MPNPRPFPRLDGPPVALPRWFDRLSERWWTLRPRWRAALLLLGAGLTVVLGLSHAAATPYGPPTTVLVAAGDLVVGQELGPGDLRRVTWPRDLVPPDALERPEGRLAAAVPAGTVATRRHLSDGGIAAALPDGMAAVPVPLDGLPSLRVGDRLEVVGRDLDGRAVVLAGLADVVAIDPTDVWLAVPAADAPGVAAAGASGALTVVVRPP